MTNSIDRRVFFQSVGATLAGSAAWCSLGNGRSLASGLFNGLSGSEPAPLANIGGKWINPQKVFLWENTRKEIRELLNDGQLKAAILPTGSIEQHNEHMSVVCDIAISTLIAQQVALALYPQVIVAPPSPCGFAPYHMARPGTVTLRKETLQAYVLDVLDSLRAHGIGTMLVLNGHGGNHSVLQEMLPEWRKELSGVALDMDSYWNGIPKEFQKQVMKAQEQTSHAGEFETSIYMAAFPGRLRAFTMQEYDEAHLDYESGFSPAVQEFLKRDARSFKDGEINMRGENGRDRERQQEALLATAKTGEALLSKAIESFVDHLRKMIAATETGQTWPLTTQP